MMTVSAKHYHKDTGGLQEVSYVCVCVYGSARVSRNVVRVSVSTLPYESALGSVRTCTTDRENTQIRSDESRQAVLLCYSPDAGREFTQAF